jgi:hypothetical protein
VTHKGGCHASNPPGAGLAGHWPGPGRRDHRACGRRPGQPDQEQTDQGQALYQSELQRNLQLRKQADNEASAEHGQAAQRKALYQSELESNLATARAASAAAGTDPATFSPGVDRLATLLVGLVMGLLGGVAAMIGWTATTRRRRPRAAAGT